MQNIIMKYLKNNQNDETLRLIKKLLESGYEIGNNCFYKKINDSIFYFNNDGDNFTTVTVKHKNCIEEILYIYANEEVLETLEKIDYGLHLNYNDIIFFINNYVDGVEESLLYKTLNCNYIDELLAEELNIPIELTEFILKDTIEKIIKKLNSKKNIEAYKSAYNEITAEIIK